MIDLKKREDDEIQAINLKMLRNMDPEVDKILFISSYCSLHELDKASKIWHACETAGPLFLVTRRSTSNLKLVLLN